MKKLLLGLCATLGAIAPGTLSANQMDVAVSGIWAIKSSQFQGGGVSARFGYHLEEPEHAFELEGLWLGETAKANYSFIGTETTVVPNPGNAGSTTTTYTGTASASKKYTMNRWGLLANYRFTHKFEGSGFGIYAGLGAGAVFTDVHTKTNSVSFIIITPVNLAGMSPPVSGQDPKKTYWSPAAQLFAGASMELMENLNLVAGGRVLFTNTKTVPGSNSFPQQMNVKVQCVQAMLEGGLNFAF